jgi:hypothetical protein
VLPNGPPYEGRVPDSDRSTPAGAAETARHRAFDAETASRTLAADTTEVPAMPPPRGLRFLDDNEPAAGHTAPDDTVVGRVDHLMVKGTPHSADAWDASPTQNLSGDETGALDGDRQTSFGAPPLPRPASKTIHDEEIQTSQAVRVVVWRDANGVHVAPAGTVVSAITVDAVLVALEPSADLTAWLSRRHR